MRAFLLDMAGWFVGWLIIGFAFDLCIRAYRADRLIRAGFWLAASICVLTEQITRVIA